MNSKQTRRDLPYIVVFTTATMDGKIASKTRFSELSCPIDLKRLHKARLELGAVMIGANTALIDDPSLRLKYFQGPNPVRIVVDGKLRIHKDLRLIREKISKTIIVTGESADRAKIKEFRDLGVDVLTLRDTNGILDMTDVARALKDIGIDKILVEGGGELIWSLVSKDLVDEFRITYTGYIFGGRDSVSIVGGEGFRDKYESPSYTIKSFELCECGREIHVVYLREYK